MLVRQLTQPDHTFLPQCLLWDQALPGFTKNTKNPLNIVKCPDDDNDGVLADKYFWWKLQDAAPDLIFYKEQWKPYTLHYAPISCTFYPGVVRLGEFSLLKNLPCQKIITTIYSKMTSCDSIYNCISYWTYHTIVSFYCLFGTLFVASHLCTHDPETSSNTHRKTPKSTIDNHRRTGMAR